MKKNLAIIFCILPLMAAAAYAWYYYKFDGLYGQDSYEYYRYARHLRNIFSGDASPLVFPWPVYYPLTASFVSYITGFPWAMAVTSWMMGISALIGFFCWLRKLFPDLHVYVIGLLTGIGLGMSPYFMRAAFLSMSDMTGLHWLVWALFFYQCFRQNSAVRNVLGFTACAMLAILSRYPVCVILLVPALSIAWKMIRTKQWYRLFYALPVAAVLALPEILLKLDSPEGLLLHFLYGWSPVNFRTTEIHHHTDGTLHFSYPNILYIFFVFGHPSFFLAGIVLFPLGIFRMRKLLKQYGIYILALGAYLFFLAGMPQQNQRFLLIALPLVVMLAGAVIQDISLRQAYKPGMWIIPLALLLSNFLFFQIQFHKIYDRYLLEKEILEELTERGSPDLYTMDMDVSVRNRDYSGIVNNTWEKEYNQFNPGEYYLVNEEKIITQWKDENPMINWEKVNRDHQLIEIEEFSQGWVLYEIR